MTVRSAARAMTVRSAARGMTVRSAPAGHAAVMTYRQNLEVPADAKGWSDPRPWSEVESATSTALTWLVVEPRADGVCGFTLAYVPYSSLGDEGVDLSWEVTEGPVNATVSRCELAGHPAAAVEELSRSLAQESRGQVSFPVGLASLVYEAVESWRGWSRLLVEAARLCCHLPRDDAGLELTVAYEPRSSSAPWSWTVSIPVPGVEYPASEWTGSSPAEALRAALEEADLWLRGVPAGHLRILPAEGPGDAID
ncbi:hypothetical protein [Kineococcus aurantiacus]|uniref:hypothetical protein n=1 Tax=Kineococcus aurantiacus TaxID=37633 RepID=UPI0031E0A091